MRTTSIPSFELGEPLLPERADDPYYYPGLVEDTGPSRAARALRRLGAYAGVGATLFVAGLSARDYLFSHNDLRVVVDITPADARVQIDGAPLSEGGSTRTSTGLMAGEHEWLAERAGYVTQREKFMLSSQGGDRRLIVSLVPQGMSGVTASSATVGEGAADMAGGVALSKRESAKHKRPPPLSTKGANRSQSRGSFAAVGFEPGRVTDMPTDSTRHSAAGAEGLLKLNSMPWSEVNIDGQHVGHTPIVDLPLRAGRHKIELSNPQLDVRRSFVIKIRPGETVTRGEKLY